MVYEIISLENGGIPLANRDIKLILTTRSFDVCRRMGCGKNIVKVEPLKDNEEAWDLFVETLGYNGRLPGEASNAEHIVSECHGLPLVIVKIATDMRGKKDARSWRSLSQKFGSNEFGVAVVDKWVIPVLRASYDHLSDATLQQCFLHLALAFLDEDWSEEINRDKLMWNLIDEGLINAELSVDQQLDECHLILSKLYNNSLLQSLSKESFSLHDMVRGMAVKIATENHGYFLRFGNMPREREWTEDMQKVMLIITEEVPSSVSPRCPKLSTLHLKWSNCIVLPNGFFINMSSLGVLDMSDSDIERLPNSLSNLESLTVLLLGGCKRLCYVPQLGKLQKLKRLDLSFTAITEVPLDLEMLVNLTYLNLIGTSQLKMEGASVVSKLSNLQSLMFDLDQETTGVLARDVQVLLNLKNISIRFCDSVTFNAFVRTIHNRNLNYAFCFHDGRSYCDDWSVPYGSLEKKVRLEDCDLNTIESGANFVLPVDVNTLDIVNNKGWRCLCDIIGESSIRDPINCFISACDGMESLFCYSGSCSFCSALKFKKLRLRDLRRLTVLCDEKYLRATSIGYFYPFWLFSDFKYLSVNNCGMKKLLTQELCARLPELEKLCVSKCESMEAIFSARDVYAINLPRLKRLALDDLKNLRSICDGIMVYDFLKSIIFRDCPNLKVCPPIQPLLIEVTDGCTNLDDSSDSGEE